MQNSEPFSFFRLFAYIFFSILLTLHSPYIFLVTRQDLILAPNGMLEYDLGGIFPHLGAAVIVLLMQFGVSVLIFAVVAIIRYFVRTLNALLVSFISILGLQAIVYANIYLPGQTKPEIIKAFGPFTLSWLFLVIFCFFSIRKLAGNSRQAIVCAKSPE